MPFFDWLPQNPKGLKEFNMWMTVQRFGQQYWLDVFPFEKEVIDDSVDEKVPLFVDVGGGIGHQCLVRLKLSAETAYSHMCSRALSPNSQT